MTKYILTYKGEDNNIKKFELKSKAEVAADIVDEIETLIEGFNINSTTRV